MRRVSPLKEYQKESPLMGVPREASPLKRYQGESPLTGVPRAPRAYLFIYCKGL